MQRGQSGGQCAICGDQGTISNWQDSAFDLRRRQLTVVQSVTQIVVAYQTAAALRDLQLLDSDCERLVFAARARDGRAVLAATDDELDELTGSVAAEANHEPGRSRQKRLDAALVALTSQARACGW